MEAFHRELREWRKAAGLTQDQAALALRWKLDRYRHLESGRGVPSGAELSELHEILRRTA